MRINRSENRPKVCHAKPGNIIQLQDKHLELLPECYIVCIKGKFDRKICDNSSGLFNEKQPLCLCNLETGQLVEMPHLSTRVKFLYNAELVTNEGDTE